MALPLLPSSNLFCPCIAPVDDNPYGVESLQQSQNALSTVVKEYDPEALLAKEMHSLSVQERSKALEDLHCVAEEEELNPSHIERYLDMLDREITKQKSEAYAIAEASSREYVSNRDFRLMFLRADSYDAEKAARRLMSYFDHKRWLFGDAKLTSEIQQSDLSPDDLETLACGTLQKLAHPDRAGRPVILVYPPAQVIKEPMNLVRIIKPSWEVLHIMLTARH